MTYHNSFLFCPTIFSNSNILAGLHASNNTDLFLSPFTSLGSGCVSTLSNDVQASSLLDMASLFFAEKLLSLFLAGHLLNKIS